MEGWKSELMVRIRLRDASFILRNMFLNNLLATPSFMLYNRDIVQSLRDLRGSV